MTEDTASADETLCAAYREEADHYARALELAAGLPAQFGPAATGADRVAQILHCLQEVARVEVRIAGVKSRWQQQGGKPGKALADILARVADLIGRLRQGMDAAEQAAVDRQQALAPLLASATRGRQMQTAYAAVMHRPRTAPAPGPLTPGADGRTSTRPATGG